jgi:hypothetical protein
MFIQAEAPSWRRPPCLFVVSYVVSRPVGVSPTACPAGRRCSRASRSSAGGDVKVDPPRRAIVGPARRHIAGEVRHPRPNTRRNGIVRRTADRRVIVASITRHDARRAVIQCGLDPALTWDLPPETSIDAGRGRS